MYEGHRSLHIIEGNHFRAPKEGLVFDQRDNCFTELEKREKVS